mmetsp:Transcript_38139/g.79956  ORF Transcript_38139/g.79956 Transcript_38139/m.79956 type:complete len:414 (-) Transcript_38139:293-1534(-)
MSSTADKQYAIALFILPKISCILSALGSLMIISQVSRSQFNRTKPQQRIMLGISVIDFQTSIVWIFTSFFMPSESEALLATGNQKTCDAQGFVVQFSVAGVLYMCSLQFQYLLVIKYGWGERRIRNVEKWFHAVPILFGGGTAIAALVLEQYNAANWDCWIAPSPPNCTSSYEVNKGNSDSGLTETDCVRGDNAEFYRWAFFFAPLWASIIFCIVAMVLVYRSVEKTESKSADWNETWRSPPRTTRGDNNRNKSEKRTVIPRVANQTSNQSLSDKVKSQNYWYSTAFFVVWMFPTIGRFIQLSGNDMHPVVGVLAGTFIGSQGLFNALIYFRPRYYKCVKYDKWYQKVGVLVYSTLFFCCYDGDCTKDDNDYVEPNQHRAALSRNVIRQGSNLRSNNISSNGGCEDEEKQEES